MANFCTSRLSCEKEILDNIVKNYITNGNFDFNAIIPAEGNDDRSEKWGTKWYPEDVERENENTIRFSNPWSPPRPIIHKLAELYEGHEFRVEYHDEVYEFSGEEHIKYEENTLKRKGWVSDSDGKREFSSERRAEEIPAQNQSLDDVWVENDHGGQTLSHTFGDIKGFFHVDVGNYANGYVALIYNANLQSLEKGDDSLSLVLPGTNVDENVAFTRKTVEAGIEIFDQKQKFTEYDIMEYFSSRFKERQQEIESTQEISMTAQSLDRQLELAKKTAYVQGVCECVAAIGDGYAFGKKLLSEMNVTKEMAKKYANPETYKTLEQGIFAPRQEQKQEQTHNIRR